MKHEGEKVTKEEGKKPPASGLLIFPWPYLLFFVLCFLYFWLVVEPHLIYYGFGTLLPDAPLFAAGWSHFKDAVGRRADRLSTYPRSCPRDSAALGWGP